MLDIITSEQNEKLDQESDCLKFVLTRRPLDLLIEFAATETPPGKTLILFYFFKNKWLIEQGQLDAF